jgi:acyl-CoA synthetase (AMP-forming)/AMP-acid ligase II
MSDWNFADIWELVAAAHPDRPAQIQGSRCQTWAELERNADGLAATLLGRDLGHQAKVANYLYNCPEYLESTFASWKAGLVPVNTNYRYGDTELLYLWDNADAEAVVFHGDFAERVARLRDRLPRVRTWLWVDDGTGPCPDWALDYAEAIKAAAGGTTTSGPWGRSGDDLILMYTGGTTGMPKGVMWRQDDMFAFFNSSARVRYPVDGTLDDIKGILDGLEGPQPLMLPCPPLMHGNGVFTSQATLTSAGAIVLLESRKFSPAEMLDAVERHSVGEVTIVGDAFAKPILAALDAEPDRWDLSSLWLMVSSGVMWSAETKAGLLRHVPRLLCVDTYGSSEALGVAKSRSSRSGTVGTARFVLSPDARVISDEGKNVVPGSGEIGMLAVRGRIPLGYYKDPEKTANTFRVVDGQRWSIPGDAATVEADGSVVLLGRGSVCINTGGEKVFPEEVEEVLKTHPSVADAVVVGVPDERFGETVVAVVQPSGSGPVDDAALVAHVKDRLAHYKAPRHVVIVTTIGRSEAGKVDYRRLRAEAVAALQPSSSGADPGLPR